MTKSQVIGGVCLTSSSDPIVPIYSATVLNGIAEIPKQGESKPICYKCRFNVQGTEVVVEYSAADLALADDGDMLLVIAEDEGDVLSYRQIFPPAAEPKVKSFSWKQVFKSDRPRKDGKWASLPMKNHVLRRRGGNYTFVG